MLKKTMRVEPVVIFSVKPRCPACGCGYIFAPKAIKNSPLPLSGTGKCIWCGWPAAKWGKKPGKKFLKRHRLA